MKAQPVITHPGEGARVRAFGNEILFALTTEQTRGALSLGLAEVPAGHGPPMHVHDSDDELFIILEGDYSFCTDGTWSDAGPGSVVFLPRGVEHTFKVVGSSPGRHWTLTTPGGFDTFYSRCAEVFAAPGPPNFARVSAIAAEHGYRFTGPASGTP
jgi:quercetin dioxygenase-like cupin family protein